MRTTPRLRSRLLALAVIAGGIALAARPSMAEDVWEGKIELGGGATLRLVVRVAKAEAGALTAKADSPDQGASDLKVDSIAIDKTTFKFAMKGLAASYSGKLNAEGDEAVGEWTQRGKTFPLTLKRFPPAKVEVWQGKLEVGGGVALRLVLKVAKHEGGLVRATFASPDQGAGDLEVDTVAGDDKALKFTIKRIDGAFSGKVDATGSEAVGEWTQGGATFPLTLRKTDKVTEARRPQTPKPPFPYVSENVRYKNEKSGETLAGTLTRPKGEGPFAAVLLISGSGAQDRDETLLGHKPFLVLADDLTRRGIAVLRVDDRGVGGSTGDPSKATSEDFADDVRAGVAYLKGRKEVDPRKIGLAGHSEGGLIAPMVAAGSDDVAFLVLMAGTGVPGDEILQTQAGLIMAAMGANEGNRKKTLESQKRLIEIAKTETDAKEAKAKMRTVLQELTKSLPEDEQAELKRHAASVDAQITALCSPWFRYFLTYDPRPALTKVRCPVLAINGEKDLQVPPKENLGAIEAALRSGGNTRVTVRELPGLNHLFQTCKTGAPSEYSAIEETFSPAALKLIGDWIQDRVAAGPEAPRRP